MASGLESNGGYLATPFIRVLVVDDFEPFRRVVCTILDTRPEFQVIGEASDGLQAVQKAEELQPDLILLDIGMPASTESRPPAEYPDSFQPQKSSSSAKKTMRT